MKKTACLLLAICLIFLCGCSKNEEADANLIAAAGDYKLYLADNGSYNMHYKSKISDLYWSPSRNYTPRMSVCDADGDGEEELMLILYKQLKTAQYVERMSIIEADENADLTEYVCEIDSQSIAKKLDAKLENDTTVVLTASGEEYYLALSVGESFDSLFVDEAVTYSATDEGIVATVRVGLYYKGNTRPVKYGNVLTSVNYKNGAFSLGKATYQG